MEKSYLFSTTFNNVVFSGRNKAYGAYVLRQQYSNTWLWPLYLPQLLFQGHWSLRF